MQSIVNGHNDQYFTKEPICNMMVVISVGSPTDGQPVAASACGSGSMPLSAAKINRHLKLYGSDLNIVCCKMALVNMLLNSLQGGIAHMNTLTNEFYKGYKVATTMVDGCHYPDYTKFTESEYNHLWIKPMKELRDFNRLPQLVRVSKPINCAQGLLF